MKTELSAGGIIVRKYRSSWQYLLILDMNNSWTFPKGKIENGESIRQTAIREISEEVRLHDLVYISKLPPVHYTYKRNGTIQKTVHYYLFRYDGNETPFCQKSEGIHDVQWFSYAKALSMIGYPDTNTILLKKTYTTLHTIL